MLCADPNKRPSIQQALSHCWFDILNGNDYQNDVTYQENQELFNAIETPNDDNESFTVG